MVTFGRQGRGVFVGAIGVLLLGVQVASAQTSTLPSGWTNRDIGNPPVAGSAQSDGDVITVRGAGADIGGKFDQFHFVYRATSGDLDVRVSVANLWSISPGAKAGLMIRESLTETAKNAFVLVSPEQGAAFQWRSRDKHQTAQVSGEMLSAPAWLRLVRQGKVFRAYSSRDGSEWTLLGSTTINMSGNAYVGLAATSHDPSQVATAVFDDLDTGSFTPSLPAPWKTRDIGNPPIPGLASETGGTFTIVGSGKDISRTFDQFRYVYQPVTGDTQITAFVSNIQGANVWSKAGVMIRESLAASGAHASVFATPSGPWVSVCRLLAGNQTYQVTGSADAPPGWVRLVREGNLFSSYLSRDGSTWTLIETETIPMPETVYVGLAVTSRSSSATATATISSVEVRPPAGVNEPPTVSISTPATGAAYPAPADISISASAADTDGTVTRVDFYADATLVGSDTTAPFATTWSNVAEGTYSLTAVAVDDDGDTTTSVPVTVKVGAGNKPPTVSISAPAAGATFTAPANIAIAASAGDEDGSVTRVDFYAGTRLVGSDSTSPYAVTWSGVEAGTHTLTAVATDNDGDTATSQPVTVTVEATNKPPTVAISSPAGGATFTAPASIAITATASDADGSVTRVDFYAGPNLVGSDTASPFTTTWSNVAQGTYALTAVATDNDGEKATSAPVSVTVEAANKPPTVAISSPAGGATFTAPANIAITATAGDTDGSVTRVDFYAGTTLVGSDTASPFTAAWNNVAAGSYALTAVATDNDGEKTTSAPVSVTVEAANKPPAVAISSPAGGATFTAPANIAITAAASDTDGSVARVDFYAGATLVGSDTASPFTAAWNNVAAGSYALTAVATDNDGDKTTSSPVTLTVEAPNKPPVVSIASPALGATFLAPATIAIEATAGDTDGSVTRVDFYAGTQLVGSDVSRPFTAVWGSVPAGTYNLTAVATDDDGAKASSPAVSVTVAAPAPTPRTLMFTPGADYATNVDSVTVQLRRSVDPVTATPVATRNLGKPPVVSGEVSADISTLIDPLAAGSYYAVVVATGPGGSTASSPSPAFTK